MQLTEVEELRSRLATLEAALREVLDRLPPDGSKDWWCPECKELLSWQRVTYQECCDTCGTHLPSWPSDTETLRGRIAALLAGRGEGEA